jgi:hypothetical protein
MRACFLGQNICALGNGIAMLQIPPLVADHPLRKDGQPPSELPVREKQIEKKTRKDAG